MYGKVGGLEFCAGRITPDFGGKGKTGIFGTDGFRFS